MQIITELVVLLCFFQYFCDVGVASKKTRKCDDPRKRLIGVKSMSNSDKRIIIAKHNELRNLVASGGQKNQPPAENMMEMTWDDHGEEEAFKWASRCVTENNPPRDENNKPMGQNIAVQFNVHNEDINKTFDAHIDGFIQNWYDEVNQYRFGDQGYSMPTEHYKQVIWAKTFKIGCGFSYFQQNGMNVAYLVCNYSPAGNELGQNPYEIGKANCGKYRLYYARRYRHLCTKRRI